MATRALCQSTGSVCRAAFLLLISATLLPAQAVRGELVEQESGGPIAGSLVTLRDAAGAKQGQALTDAVGRFLLRAPRAGRYTLKAERVGQTTTVSEPLELRAGETLQYRMRASSAVIALEGIRAEGKSRRCTLRPAEGLATATLWEEVRKALDATAFTQREKLFRYEIVQYQRDMDPEAELVRQEERANRRGVATHPFVSLPAEELSRGGYVQNTPEGTFYYGPDAYVLLSDAFLDDHCFRVAEDEAAGDSLIGLAFEPLKERRVPDIKGTLWLDRGTAELKRLEYRYVRAPVDIDAARLGGRMEFQRLPNGAWIVRRWYIRMPEVAVEEGRSTRPGSDGFHAYRRESLVGIRETGGEILRTAERDAPATPTLAAATATLDRAAVDSIRAATPAAAAQKTSPPTRQLASAEPDTVAPLRLPGIVATAQSDEFSRRARTGSGRYITREKIAEMKPTRTTDIFREIPRLELIPGQRGMVLRFRGKGTPRPTGVSAIPLSTQTGGRPMTAGEADTPADCPPDVYLDGARWIEADAGEIDAMRPEDVEGVEVYSSAAAAPGRYKRLDAVCGIILIWTRVGRR